MATPFADPRTGRLYFRRAVPERLRSAFGGRAQVKVSLGTRDPAEARIAFARENARFEEQLADARRRMAEGTLVPTPAAVVRRWCEAPGVGAGLAGPQRLVLTFMELDAAVGARHFASSDEDPYPPAVIGAAANTDWAAVLADRSRYDSVLAESYGDDPERAGSNWIRVRWHEPVDVWMPHLAGPVARLRAFDAEGARFADDELARALLAAVDERRTDDEDVNRARLARHRPRTPQPRRRPHLRLGQLLAEWKAGTDPRPQTAKEFAGAVDDFIDFAGDLAVSEMDADLLYDYRDEAARLPASMPRADRALPFRVRVAKHAESEPKCAAPTLKKRIGALQALLTYAFRQRWTATNAGTGIVIVGYAKNRRRRRSFEDHELAALCAAPLFTDPSSWRSTSRISDATVFWLFLLGITTGARLEEVGQVSLADVKRDGTILYLDIDEYALDDEAAKTVKTEESIRLVPIHERLLELGFDHYLAALAKLGHTRLFPDLRENSVGKRTKEASQRMNRIIDRHVSADRRLVFYSTRHAFKAKGNDAGLSDRTLDQICGHAPISTGGRYGAEPRIRTLHEALHRIDFSCIDWKPIRKAARSISWEKMLRERE